MTDSSHSSSRRVAVVTGGSGGIGQAVVDRFVAAGHAVVLVDRDRDGAESVARELVRRGACVEARAIDVMAPEHVADLWEWIDSAFGRCDILVNSAGVARLAPFHDVTHAEWARTLGVNVTGPLLMSQAAALRMAVGHWGRIVNVTSVSGLRAGWGRTAYGTSKAALTGLTRQMAIELAQHDVTVNAVAPGPVSTHLASQNHSSAATDAYHRMVPMGRYATPEEVAAAVAFLCSDDAGYITGHTLPVDGGYLAAGVLEA